MVRREDRNRKCYDLTFNHCNDIGSRILSIENYNKCFAVKNTKE